MPRKKKQDNGATETNNAPRPKPKSATAKKAPAKKATGRRKGVVATATEPSDEQIRIRAYFISERRRRLDIHGDASSDWIEAKRQLLSESGPR